MNKKGKKLNKKKPRNAHTKKKCKKGRSDEKERDGEVHMHVSIVVYIYDTEASLQ